MDDVKVFRRIVTVLLALLVLFYGAKVAFSIYEWGHQDEINLWCDWDSSADHGNGAYKKSYAGPADKVIGACDVRR